MKATLNILKVTSEKNVNEDFDIYRKEKEYLSRNFTAKTFKRGRFTVEDYSGMVSKREETKKPVDEEPKNDIETSKKKYSFFNLKNYETREYKKGRFHIVEAVPKNKPDEIKKLYDVIDLQNQQINLLYSMIKNGDQNDMLCDAEYTRLSNLINESMYKFDK